MVWAWTCDSVGPRPPIKFEVPFFQPDLYIHGSKQVQHTIGLSLFLDSSNSVDAFLSTYIQLTAMEMDFLSTNTNQALSAFQEVGKGGGGGSERLLAMAGSQVQSAARQ